MRIPLAVALAFTAICLLVAVLDLTATRSVSFCRGGSNCTTVDCGSPASPRAFFFDSTGDQANCAGSVSAEIALYAVVGAGLGTVAVALTARSSRRTHDPSLLELDAIGEKWSHR